MIFHLLKQITPLPIKQYLKDRLVKPGKRKRPPILGPSRSILDLELALQAGFANGATQQLVSIVHDESARNIDRAASNWALAQGAAQKLDFEGSLGFLENLRSGRTKRVWSRAQRLLYIDVLIKSNSLKEAEDQINEYLIKFPDDDRVELHRANLHLARGDADDLRLSTFNRLFDAGGFAPMAKIDPSASLSIDNVTASADPEINCPVKLSVLMPAFNSEGMITTAIMSVLGQTWGNLELIVVDDFSTDETASVVRELAQRDKRIRFIAQDRNRGAYEARNLALAHATGDYVTVHDADDWSHPQKFAAQIKEALSVDTLAPNATYGVRVSPELQVRTKPFGATQFVLNTSSLLFKRDDLVELGGWDRVRMAGDAELMDRLTVRDGLPRRLHKSVPLSLILLDDKSLTRNSMTGVNTIRYGARREYRDAYQMWHRRADQFRMLKRHYPVPSIFLPDRPEELVFDVVLVSDFSLTGGTTSSNISMLRAARDLGLDVAVFHWPRLDNATREKAIRMADYLYDEKIPRVVSGETVKTKLVIVNHPNLLMNTPEWMPNIQSEHCVVVFNQAPLTRWEGGRTAYEPKLVLQNAEKAFGVKPIVAPLSGLIRDILTDIVSEYSFTEENWSPLIKPRETVRLHRDLDQVPVVGRHARDHRDKWPEAKETTRLAYLAGTNIQVRILGGDSFAKRTLGYRPSNWEVIPFGGEDVSDFLSSLDIYLYYPHEQIIEAFGRGPMEAIEAGVPVVLPPALRPTFQEAAIYAEPSEVEDVVRRLWRDRDQYDRQVKNGFSFIRENCDSSLFQQRVSSFL